MGLDPERLLLLIPAFVIAIAIHEANHAFAATLLGDSTPRQAGRLTLNPLRHLDPMGTITLFLIGFGWGKPVFVNPFNFSRVGPIAGMALVAFAGPLANLIGALLFGLPFRFHWDLPSQLLYFAGEVVSINVLLAVFNLIPLPPLDGFSVLVGILPRSLGKLIQPLARHGPAALLAVFALSFVLKIDVIGPLIGPPMRFLLPLMIGR